MAALPTGKIKRYPHPLPVAPATATKDARDEISLCQLLWFCITLFKQNAFLSPLSALIGSLHPQARLGDGVTLAWTPSPVHSRWGQLGGGYCPTNTRRSTRVKKRFGGRTTPSSYLDAISFDDKGFTLLISPCTGSRQSFAKLITTFPQEKRKWHSPTFRKNDYHRIRLCKTYCLDKKNPMKLPCEADRCIVNLILRLGSRSRKQTLDSRIPSAFNSLEELFWRGWVFELPTAAGCLTCSIENTKKPPSKHLRAVATPPKKATCPPRSPPISKGGLGRWIDLQGDVQGEVCKDCHPEQAADSFRTTAINKSCILYAS